MSRTRHAALISLGASLLTLGAASAQERRAVTSNPPLMLYGVPAQNRGLYFGWQGFADTDVNFSQFFDADHTLTAWFMPQYTSAYQGAVFAENGAGTYHVGFGNYLVGDRSYKDQGNPVFLIQVGSLTALYLIPELKKGQWSHLAVVRRAGTIELYVNGIRKTPVKIDAAAKMTSPAPEITIPAGLTSKPTGTLRFGRRTPGTTGSNRDWQLYGTLDDVGLFTKALSATEIAAVRAKPRLTGGESGLLAAWGFDKRATGDLPLHTKMRTATDNDRAYAVNLSSDRNNGQDAVVFNNPFINGATQVQVRLPFKPNEVWKVNQEYDTADWSHVGPAAFCYDFGLVGSTAPSFIPNANTYPFGTAHAPVYNVATGKAVAYLRNGGVNDNNRERNSLSIRTATGEVMSYLHFADSSLTSAVQGGNWDASVGKYVIPDATAPTIPLGQKVGEAGPGALHLHFGGENLSDGGVTFPVAFSNYYVSSDKGLTWTPVARGIPRKGQYIKWVQ